MKTTIWIFAIFFFYSITYSQESVEGIILDNNQKPIQYANVGILNKSLGTISNQKGVFNLNLEKINQTDTLRISCIGYKAKDIIVNEIDTNKNLEITLQEESIQLDEVIIVYKDLKTFIDGKEKTDTKHQVIFANEKLNNLNLGTEIGRKFELESKKPTLLTEFKFFIKDNNFDSNTFKINIYSINKNKPDKIINTQNILISIGKDYKDWVTVNLEDFNIIVQDDVIVSVQWIEHSKNGNTLNLPMIIPSFGSVHYYKFGSQNKWEVYSKISSSMILTYKQ